MTKSIPSIQKYMTTLPHSIGAEQKVDAAEKMMQEHRIRHLPVLKSGRLVGLLSDRDVKFVRGFASAHIETSTVADIAREDVYTVSPSTPLSEVVEAMISKKLGSAVVMDNGKLVGIFTDIDAMKALDHLLHTRLTH
ncbi:MAG: CBS domain-containing protein [Bdellovibrionales bacterium]|nr:CBS domain-containing protein [Bdellovibrionales bacterium]